jgi:alpha-glucosidase
MNFKVLIVAILILASSVLMAQKPYTLKSPNDKITVSIKSDAYGISYSVKHENTTVIDYSPLRLELDNVTLGENRVFSTKKRSVNTAIESPIYKRSEITDNFNELTLNFRDNRYKIIFRAYNDGIAYRFSTSYNKDIIVDNEIVEYNFDKDYKVYAPYVNARKGEGDPIEQQFFSSFENFYTVTNLTQLESEKLIFLPMLIELEDGKKAVITESDLESYPGMYLRNVTGGKKKLSGVFAPKPKTEIQGGHNMLQYIVTERENYIAKVDGTKEFPWRIIAISDKDSELADNDLVYKLASPSRVEDVSWIKPGKVAWDWWNNWNIYGVDFQSGVNNDTYKYYIDFASKFGIEYVILDEGWAVNKQADLFQVVPEIDLQELINYATSKKVGIVLWAGFFAMNRDIEKVCKHYSEMGVKGFKVDFMDRDDQVVVDFYYKVAEMAAKYHLFVDFHGAFKPAGLQRTYPNVLNFEGVSGLEQAKWISKDTDLVTYEVTIPFIRMLAGPMDFTQGAMKNANKNNYRSIYSEPMSQGTRCRQLAEYVIFESPFNMLCDSPSNYYAEEECTEYIAGVPTTWDETIVLDGKVAEYVVIARRKADKWYIGAITNWEERTIEIDISQLNLTKDKATCFEDGVNANKVAKDYKKKDITIKNNRYTLKLAQGGGAVIIL